MSIFGNAFGVDLSIDKYASFGPGEEHKQAQGNFDRYKNGIISLGPDIVIGLKDDGTVVATG